MAVVAVSVNCHGGLGVVAVAVAETQPQSPNRCSSLNFRSFFTPIAAAAAAVPPRRRPLVRGYKESSDSQTNRDPDEEVNNLGVKAALSMLRFYKREISPLLPNSCRYVPTCSEYSMEAYKKYGVVKGTVLTAWRLCRCNPLGGSGFDPPRWFDEKSLPEE